MKKILGILIVLALIWAIPPARERLGAAAVPLLEKLGPVGAGLLDPARRMGAKGQTASIARLLVNERQEGRELPNVRTFNAWLVRRSGGVDDTLDPWGQPYWLEIDRNVMTVGSSGPDRQRGTPDDVRREVN